MEHGVVHLLIALQRRKKKETKEARNVVLTILLEIKFKVAVRLVAVLDMPAEKKIGTQPQSQGPLSSLGTRLSATRFLRAL